ncbi:cytochrome C [Rheinheimera salexigens]|uniref:Cytochrome C n=1 Tax=Rheinheimera salexigens TaxID=1628148 RepID=A0A1E7Q9Z2_9GAMM|nr:cytochrome C [Rheinheimera salexigens]
MAAEKPPLKNTKVAKLAIQDELPVGKSATEFPAAPSWQQLPSGELGEKVLRGYSYFVNSQQLAPKYVGNGLNCVNCHMDAGKKENAAPLWAAYMSYPAYRKKNDKINAFQERLQGCFLYSMNGTPPIMGDDTLVDLSAYAYWLAQATLGNGVGAKFTAADIPVPTDAELLQGGKRDDFPFMPAYLAAGGSTTPVLPGRGYPKIDEPTLPGDITRGKVVYQQQCVACHGSNGQGQQVNQRYVFPPLWGPDSYNWGAGMQRVNTAAYFIKHNMPLGMPNSLSDQEAWDVASYLDSRDRPQDPRYQGDIKQTRRQFHGNTSYYGTEVDGKILGNASYPNHPNKGQ